MTDSSLHIAAPAAVEIVDPRDRPDVAAHYFNPHEPKVVAMVSFTTDIDLAEYARRNEYNIAIPRTSVCEKRQQIDNSRKYCRDDPSHIYGVSDEKIDAYLDEPDKVRYPYHAYFNLQPIRLAGRTQEFKYDNSVQSRGRVFPGGGWKHASYQNLPSNVFIISKAAIANALATKAATPLSRAKTAVLISGRGSNLSSR